MRKYLLKNNAELLALSVPLGAVSAFMHNYSPVAALGGILIIHGAASVAFLTAFVVQGGRTS